MTTTKITLRNYRTYLLNKAAIIGDATFAETIKALTANALKSLFENGYYLPIDANTTFTIVNTYDQPVASNQTSIQVLEFVADKKGLQNMFRIYRELPAGKLGENMAAHDRRLPLWIAGK